MMFLAAPAVPVTLHQLRTKGQRWLSFSLNLRQELQLFKHHRPCMADQPYGGRPYFCHKLLYKLYLIISKRYFMVGLW